MRDRAINANFFTLLAAVEHLLLPVPFFKHMFRWHVCHGSVCSSWPPDRCRRGHQPPRGPCARLCRWYSVRLSQCWTLLLLSEAQKRRSLKILKKRLSRKRKKQATRANERVKTETASNVWRMGLSGQWVRNGILTIPENTIYLFFLKKNASVDINFLYKSLSYLEFKVDA
jgi:hypothetical protein